MIGIELALATINCELSVHYSLAILIQRKKKRKEIMKLTSSRAVMTFLVMSFLTSFVVNAFYCRHRIPSISLGYHGHWHRAAPKVKPRSVIGFSATTGPKPKRKSWIARIGQFFRLTGPDSTVAPTVVRYFYLFIIFCAFSIR